MWFFIGLVVLIAVVAIVVSRRGSTTAHDRSIDHRPDTSSGPPSGGGGFDG